MRWSQKAGGIVHVVVCAVKVREGNLSEESNTWKKFRVKSWILQSACEPRWFGWKSDIVEHSVLYARKPPRDHVDA